MISFKKLFLTVTLILLSLVATTPLAQANYEMSGATKSPLYNLSNPEDYTCEGGGNISETTAGSVIVNTDGKPSSNKKVQVTVILKNALSNTSYDVWISQHPGDCVTTVNGSLTTDGDGSGSKHFSENRLNGATNFWVSVTGGGQTLRSPAVLLD